MARRPRFESRRGKPYKETGVMRQNEYNSFQYITTGFRLLSQMDGWSRGYKDTNQTVPIDRTHTDKIFG